MFPTFKLCSYCWAILWSGIKRTSFTLISPSDKIFEWALLNLRKLSSTLKWCVCFWSGSVSVQRRKGGHTGPALSQRPHIWGEAYTGLHSSSAKDLRRVEDLRLLPAETRWALSWKHTRELWKWNSHAPEYTMDSRCKLEAHIFSILPHFYFSPFFFSSSLCRPFLPPWVIVRTQTLQPRQNINTLLMPSHSNSPESWCEEKNVEGRWSWRQIQTLIVLVRD